MPVSSSINLLARPRWVSFLVEWLFNVIYNVGVVHNQNYAVVTVRHRYPGTQDLIISLQAVTVSIHLFFTLLSCHGCSTTCNFSCRRLFTYFTIITLATALSSKEAAVRC